MNKLIDLKLRKNEDGIYDLSIADGDFVSIEGFDTAIQMSILCERRASESEQKQPQRRRGWWGNEASDVVNFEIGSKLWIFANQSRLTNDTINRGIDFGQQCLQWMVDDDFLDRVVVTGEIKNPTTAVLEFELIKDNNIVDRRGYDIWRKTFTNGEI